MNSVTFNPYVLPAALCFVAYQLITFITAKKVLGSISESYYWWKDNKKYSAAFVLFGSSICLSLWIAEHYMEKLYAYPSISRLLIVIAACFLFLVTVAAPFRIKKVGLLHVCFTITCLAMLTVAGVIPYWPNWLSLWPLAIGGVGTFLIKKSNLNSKTTWTENIWVGCILLRFLLV